MTRYQAHPADPGPARLDVYQAASKPGDRQLATWAMPSAGRARLAGRRAGGRAGAGAGPIKDRARGQFTCDGFSPPYPLGICTKTKGDFTVDPTKKGSLPKAGA